MQRLISSMLLACVVLLSACDSGGSNDSSEASISGTYNLETVEGLPLPYVVAQVLNDKLEVTAGHMRINSDNTFSARITYRMTEAGVTDSEDQNFTGNYTVTGTSVRFNYSDGSTDTGSLTGSTLTLNSVGFTFVFKK